MTRVVERARGLMRVLGLIGVIGFTGLSGCSGDEERGQSSDLDTRLETHAVMPGDPSEAGLAYVEAVASAHARADQSATPSEAIEILLAAVELEPPAKDGVAEQLRYELLARTSEALVREGRTQAALALLEPNLDPTRSLPVDRSAARCLVSLGDAAAALGDHGLAMGSYARALEMLMLLLEEVEP